MKPDTDPLFPAGTGSNNNDIDVEENTRQDDETSKLLVSTDTKPKAEADSSQNTRPRTPSDPDGLMVPLINYQRPSLARSISGGSACGGTTNKYGGKRKQELPPNGTLNVSFSFANLHSWESSSFKR